MSQHDLNELAIKAQNKLVEALRDSQESYERLLQNTSGSFAFRYDIQGVFEYVSPNITEVLGYSPSEFCTLYSTFLSDDDINSGVEEHIHMGLRGTKQDAYQLSMFHKSGGKHLLQINQYSVFDYDKTVIAVEGFAHDITLLKQMEFELRHSQKMSALGTLTGGVAHNFNNLLAGIKGNNYLAIQKAKAGTSVVKHLERIDLLCENAAGLVNQLMAYSRRDALEKSNFDFTAMVTNTVSTVKVGYANDILISESITNEMLIVNGDEAQLQQVMINIMNNAKDALAGQKEKRVSVSLVREGCQLCSNLGNCSVRHDKSSVAHLTIEDNGCGIATEHQELVFDPFFTTKEINKGTGLGLSTSVGAIESHGGNILLDSKVGHGSKFTICIPIVDAEVTTVLDEDTVSISGEGRSILVMDDNPEMIDLLEDVLSSLGFHVVVAQDGKQGLDCFLSHDDIDLIISDITMPVMDGIASIQEIRQTKATVPVIFITGHVSDSSYYNLPDDKNTKVIQKPFAIPALTRLIAELFADK